MNLIDNRPEYPPEWDYADAKEELVNERMNELLEEECDPFEPGNLAEFIGNLDPKNEDEKAMIVKLLVLIVKYKDDFKPIIEACEDYWVKAAEKQAIDEFESGDLFDDGEP